MPNERDGASGLRFEAPSFRTSRRNFLAGVSTLAGALVATTVVGKSARADMSLPGCQASGGVPPKCHCFLSGTRIATPNGEVEIEKLQIGDLVTCVSGAPKPIKWIGRNRFTRTSSEAWQPGRTPIKVSKFALDGQTPHADLFLTPAHSIYLGGLLVPVKDLLNGISITENHYADALTLDYYHIDLEDHDAVFAEGAPAETYQGNDYLAFDNSDEYVALYGAPPVHPKQPFAPVISFYGGRQELRSRLRSVIAPVYDVRQPIDVIRDEIASRAELAWAA